VSIEVSGDTVGPAPARVLLSEGGEPVSGATVEVQGDMSHAGMQPVIVQAVEGGPGVYDAADFVFTMAGDWFLTATVETADGRKVTGETFLTVRSR